MKESKLVKADIQLMQVLASLGIILIRNTPENDRLEVIKSVTDAHRMIGVEISPESVISFINEHYNKETKH